MRTGRPTFLRSQIAQSGRVDVLKSAIIPVLVSRHCVGPSVDFAGGPSCLRVMPFCLAGSMPWQSFRSSFVTTLLVLILAVPSVLSAQQASGIAGLVRDTSGAVLPGVTVEAASPALIEKVRTAVTGSDGRFNIVDLRPGTYAVTFSLTGFKTFRRDGIDLTAGFTATINGEMAVGALEETITVTSAAPLVDTQNIRQQESISNELVDALPSASRGRYRRGTSSTRSPTRSRTRCAAGGSSRHPNRTTSGASGRTACTRPPGRRR